MVNSFDKIVAAVFLMAELLFADPVFSQKKDSSHAAAVNGVVRDSAHNYVLGAATLSIYRAADSSLVGYLLSDNFGEFTFKELPVDIPLRIVASYTGYKTYSRGFTVKAGWSKMDLGNLNMERRGRDLDEVVVTYRPPPVQMKGDTLEFNADAFKLDSNAVVGDLLRKLPGITVWGDGTITVNGRAVHNVFVEGKPFFGSDARIATQNIPKSAVDKIQVYREKNEQDVADSTLDVNIKLKRNSKSGIFGKISAGYGTGGRYDADATLNMFSPRTQVSVVGASNNVNKMADNFDVLLRNATYKGISAEIDYQPDFTTEGVNRSNSGGFSYHHDFIDNSTYNNKNGVDASYFVTNPNSSILKSTKTTISLGGDSSMVQNVNSSNNSRNTIQDFDSRYDWVTKKKSFYLAPSFSINDSHNQSMTENSSRASNDSLQSSGNTFGEANSDVKNILIETGYKSQSDNDRHIRLPKNIEVDYTFNSKTFNSNQTNVNSLTSQADSSQNENFNRKYNLDHADLDQRLFLKVGNLKRLIFNDNIESNINIELQNVLFVNGHKETNRIADLDTLTQVYAPNQYLTNRSTYNTFNDMPALNINKTIIRTLANRYQKALTVNLSAQEQFFNQANTSQKLFQDFDRSYQYFVPNGSISYNNNQVGDFQSMFSLGYKTLVEYPTVDQIAPLVDSANIYSFQEGNPGIKPSYKHEMAFSLQNINLRSANTFNYDISLSAGMVKKNMTDSTMYDKLGRSIHYYTNVDGYRYLTVTGNLKKAYKFKESQLQLTLNGTLNISRAPNYVNGSLNISDNSIVSGSIGLYYTWSDLVALSLGQKLSLYKSEQTGLNTTVDFINSGQSTILSASLNCTKKLTLSSNVTYCKTTSSGSNDIHFTIWDAFASYRFLKGNKAELKMSALDLLHQNTGVVNYGMNNNLTIGRTNALQQYFMVTLAYFIRKFGNK